MKSKFGRKRDNANKTKFVIFICIEMDQKPTAVRGIHFNRISNRPTSFGVKASISMDDVVLNKHFMV